MSAKDVAQGLAALALILRPLSIAPVRLSEAARAKLDSELERLTRCSGAGLKEIASAFTELGKDNSHECEFLFALYVTRQVKPESVETVRKFLELNSGLPLYDSKGKVLPWPWAEVKGRPTLLVRKIQWPYGAVTYSVAGFWSQLEGDGIMKHLR